MVPHLRSWLNHGDFSRLSPVAFLRHSRFLEKRDGRPKRASSDRISGPRESGAPFCLLDGEEAPGSLRHRTDSFARRASRVGTVRHARPVGAPRRVPDRPLEGGSKLLLSNFGLLKDHFYLLFGIIT